MQLKDVLDAMHRSGGLIPQLGMQLEQDDDGVSCVLPITQELTGAPGVAHGGAVMALLDTALGATAMAHALPLHKATSTVEMKVNFMRPAHLGRSLRARATLQSAGRSLLVVTGSAVDEDTGETVAFAVGTFNLFALQKVTARNAR